MYDLVIYTDDTSLYSKYDRASDLWQQIELSGKLVSNFQDTMDRNRKWFASFNAGQT